MRRDTARGYAGWREYEANQTKAWCLVFSLARAEGDTDSPGLGSWPYESRSAHRGHTMSATKELNRIRI